MDARLLELIACPVCRGKLLYDQQDQELICREDRLMFKINEGVPVMHMDSASSLSPGDF